VFSTDCDHSSQTEDIGAQTEGKYDKWVRKSEDEISYRHQGESFMLSCMMP